MAAGTPQTSSYREVERKFEAIDATVAPSFEGLSAVTRVERVPTTRLEAVYFDTADLDLAARGLTLRRRTGGPDAGWHLKLPAGPDTRTEVRAPLETDGVAGEVPEALRDVVLAVVRDRPLRPVAQIATRRTVDLLYGAQGTLVAEFCDDQVTATAGDTDTEPQQWREWELEVTDRGADRKLLDRLANRLVDAGAMPATHGSKLARVLNGATDPAKPAKPADRIHRAVAKEVDKLLVWDRAVRADGDDAVHQMRVTIRKLRSLLQSAAPAFGIDDDPWVLDELRQLAAVLGEARDAEVLAERYQCALDALPADLVRGPIREQLVDGAQRRYQIGLRRSLAAMRSARYFRLLDALEALARADARPAADEPAPVSLDAAYKRVRKAAKAAARAADDADRDEALHRIRKGAKRLRYTAAAAGADKVAERAKAVQTLLGDHQDSVVSRTQLSQQAKTGYAAGADTFTYGLLHQQEADLAQQCREQLDGALKKLDKAVRKAR